MHLWIVLAWFRCIAFQALLADRNSRSGATRGAHRFKTKNNGVVANAAVDIKVMAPSTREMALIDRAIISIMLANKYQLYANIYIHTYIYICNQA